MLFSSFNVPQRGCGTVSQSSPLKSANSFQRSLEVSRHQQEPEQIFLENTIIIQHDPDFQEAGDMARRIRCVWVFHLLIMYPCRSKFHSKFSTGSPILAEIRERQDGRSLPAQFGNVPRDIPRLYSSICGVTCGDWISKQSLCRY